MIGYWLVDRMLPNAAATVLVASATYVWLHFKRDWPYWGRRLKDRTARRYDDRKPGRNLLASQAADRPPKPGGAREPGRAAHIAGRTRNRGDTPKSSSATMYRI